MTRAFARSGGFTLLEMAMLMVIIGILLAAFMRVYNGFLNDHYARDTQTKLNTLDSAVANFIGANGRLPCPSNPTLPVTDPNAGREIPLASCTTLRTVATPIGTCLDGVCKVNGARHTEATPGTTPNDPVLVGGFPWVAVLGNNTSLNGAMSTDAWNYQFTYAVSGFLTNKATYRSSWGAIDIRTEPDPTGCAGIGAFTCNPRPDGTPSNPNDPLQPTYGGVSLVSPPGSSQYVIIGHGPNHVGAYTSGGRVSVPCMSKGTQDSDNCDNNPVVDTTASFTVGLRRDGNTTSYKAFDDTLKYNSYSLSSLWDFVGTTTDIHNLNPGYIGVGTATPTQQLDVNGSIKATTLAASQLCDSTGADCWSPDLLSAPASSGASLYCPNTNTPGMADVMTGVTNDLVTGLPKAVCTKVLKVTPLPNQTCPAGQYLNGFDSTGTIICYSP